MGQMDDTSSRSEDRDAFPYVLPAVLYLLLVVLFPFIELVYYSLTDKRAGHDAHWVGLGNFAHLLSSGGALPVLQNTARYAIGSTLPALCLGLSVALLIYSRQRRLSGLELVIMIPWAIPPTITALVWQWMFYDVGGVFNWILMKLAIIHAPVSWLGSARIAVLAVLFPNVWRLTPFFAITLLAARSRMDHAPYEAAALDGAGAWRTFLFVTLPGLRRTILVSSMFSLLWSATEFPLVYILTRGGPGSSTHLVGTFSYELALRGGFELGLGSANSLLLLPVAIGLAASIWKLGSWLDR